MLGLRRYVNGNTRQNCHAFRVNPRKHQVCERALPAEPGAAWSLRFGCPMDIIELKDALPDAHAPVDEPATSADELSEDDEAVCLLSLSPPEPGAWVVLHGIVGKPELNGRVGVLIDTLLGSDGSPRWDCHMLLEALDIAIKPANLSVMAPCTWKSGGDERRRQMEQTEAVVTRVLESFVASDAAELEFPKTLSGEARNKVHSVCSDLGLDKKSIGQGGERYIVVSKQAADEGPSSAGSLQEQGDLNDLRFVEVLEYCTRTAHALHTHCTRTAHALHTYCTRTRWSSRSSDATPCPLLITPRWSSCLRCVRLCPTSTR